MSTPIQPVPDVVLASEFPSLADRPADTYNAKAKAWADSENAMAQSVREIAVVGHNNAVAATEQANIALQAAQDASDSADAAQVSSEQAGQYRDSAEAIAAAIGSDAGLPSLIGNAGKALLVDPGETGVGWYDVLPTLKLRPVTTGSNVGPLDRAHIVECVGAFALSFDSADSLGDGWFCYVKNAGSGNITLSASGSNQIDGLSTFVIYPGEVRLIQCSGSSLSSIKVAGANYMVCEDQKPQGTDGGGTSTEGASVTRTLNTVISNSIFGASLSGNQISLPKGVYRMTVEAPVYSNTSVAWIAQSSNPDVSLIRGRAIRTGNGNDGVCTIDGFLELSATTSILVRQRFQNVGGSAFGRSAYSGPGSVEIYTRIAIEKVA